MAAWGCEFYLQVPKVSLTSEHSIKDNFFYSSSKQQKVVIYCKMPVTEM